LAKAACPRRSSSGSGCSIRIRPNPSSSARWRVGQPVRRVRVDLQPDVAEALAHCRHDVDVPARFDLQLDPVVALRQETADRVEQLRDRRPDPDRHSCRYRLAHRAQPLAQRDAGRAQLRIEHGHLHGRLRHPVPADRLQCRSQPVRGEVRQVP
jgi:hypothetical protein